MFMSLAEILYYMRRDCIPHAMIEYKKKAGAATTAKNITM